MEAIEIKCKGCGYTLPPRSGYVVCERCGQTHWVGQAEVVKFDREVSVVPSIRTIAVLFLTQVLKGDETTDEITSLWGDTAHRHNMCAIHAKNADRLREQVASFGEDYAPPYKINQLAAEVKGVSTYVAELAKFLGVKEDMLFKRPDEEIIKSAKGVLSALCQIAWEYRFDQARKALKKALGLPEDWNGGE